jgi:hypothetical protein
VPYFSPGDEVFPGIDGISICPQHVPRAGARLAE